MLRMAHRLLTQKAISIDPDHHEADDPVLIQAARLTYNDLTKGIPVIIADNVCRYCNSLDFKGKLSFSDLPALAPPFHNFFIEWNMPPKVRLETGGECDSAELGRLQIGCHIFQVDRLDLSMLRRNGMTPELEEKIAQHRVAVFYSTLKRDGRVCPLGTCYILSAADGSVLFAPMMTFDGDNNHVTDGRRSMEVIIALYTLGFMQARGRQWLDVTESEGPPPKWCRRQRVREIKYSCIRVNPSRRRSSRRGDRKTEGDRSGKALHIRKGHFRDYIDDGISKGFMGKYIFGTIWVEEHWVGSLDEGQVISTYFVDPPDDNDDDGE